MPVSLSDWVGRSSKMKVCKELKAAIPDRTRAVQRWLELFCHSTRVVFRGFARWTRKVSSSRLPSSSHFILNFSRKLIAPTKSNASIWRPTRLASWRFKASLSCLATHLPRSYHNTKNSWKLFSSTASCLATVFAKTYLSRCAIFWQHLRWRDWTMWRQWLYITVLLKQSAMAA